MTMIGERRPYSTDVKREEEKVQNDRNNNSEVVMEKMHDETGSWVMQYRHHHTSPVTDAERDIL